MKTVASYLLVLFAILAIAFVGGQDYKDQRTQAAVDTCNHTFNLAHTPPTISWMTRCVKAETELQEDDDR